MPGLKMMGLQSGGCAAVLTGEIITLENITAPMFIFPGSSSFVWIVNARSSITAFLRAVCSFMSVALGEITAALLTGERRRLFQNLSAFIGTGYAALCERLRERFTANFAGMHSASITEILPGMADDEGFAAFLASAFKCVFFWRAVNSLPVNTASAGIAVTGDRFAAFWARLHFIWHEVIITNSMRKHQRLADMGLSPRLDDKP